MSKEAWSHELQYFVWVFLEITIFEREVMLWKSGQYSSTTWIGELISFFNGYKVILCSKRFKSEIKSMTQTVCQRKTKTKASTFKDNLFALPCRCFRLLAYRGCETIRSYHKASACWKSPQRIVVHPVTRKWRLLDNRAARSWRADAQKCPIRDTDSLLRLD